MIKIYKNYNKNNYWIKKRLKTNSSRQEVANATGLTCQTIKNIEEDKIKQPRKKTVEKLEKYYSENKKQKNELAQMRANKFITITQMAKMLGVSKQYISQVETGTCQISKAQLQKYKEFYETL